jgi:hypothetical protein
LGAQDFKRGSLPAGPLGPQGPQGPQGVPGPSTGPAGGALAGSYPDPSLRPAEAWTEVGPFTSDCSSGRFCLNAGSGDAWRNRPNTGGENYDTVGFYRDPFGRVFLKGMARCRDGTDSTCGAFGTVMMRLPPGYRPAYTELFPARSAGSSSHQVEIRADGQVSVSDATAGSDFYSLSGISFRCAPSGSDGCP